MTATLDIKKKKEEEYTIEKAVCDVLKLWKAGTEMGGVEFCRKCQLMLDLNGVDRHPMDGTFMRALRRHKEEYGIKVTKPKLSVYYKEIPEQPNLDF